MLFLKIEKVKPEDYAKYCAWACVENKDILEQIRSHCTVQTDGWVGEIEFGEEPVMRVLRTKPYQENGEEYLVVEVKVVDVVRFCQRRVAAVDGIREVRIPLATITKALKLLEGRDSDDGFAVLSTVDAV